MSPLLEATYSDELSPHSQLLATIATTKQVLVPTGVSQSGTRCLLVQTWESAFKKKKESQLQWYREKVICYLHCYRKVSFEVLPNKL